MEININIGSEGKESVPSVFDVIILGAGPAGMTSAIYTSRSLLSTLVIEKIGSGGQAAVTDLIENYPGFSDGINGFELTQKMDAQARKFGARFENEVVTGMKRNSDGTLTVSTESRDFAARSVIIATGASARKLGVPGEDRFIGRGISFCATCDAAFYRDKIVAVVGGGDSAVEEGTYLTRFAKKVYIIHRRDALRACKIAQNRAMANPKIEFLWNTVVQEVAGKEKIETVALKNVKTGETSRLDIDGMFLYVGLIPNTQMFEGLNKDEQGYLITDENLRTNLAGVFVAGDCRKSPVKQVATAVGDGAIAATSVEKYIEETKPS